jgi:hypothetical protein
MLETAATLRTWRLAEKPAPEKDIPAEALADHRRAYLDYEGPVSANRGSVTRWDSGEFTWEQDDSSEVIVILAGKVCKGRLRIHARARIARLEPDQQ